MVYLRLHGDFNPGRDMAQFAYSLDNNRWENAGREIKMTFDYTRHFMVQSSLSSTMQQRKPVAMWM